MGVGPSILEVVSERRRLLRRLTAESARPGALTDELAASRSTIDRGLAELRDAGLVERRDGAYRATVAGSLALTEFDRLSDRLADVSAASGLLEALPPDAAVTRSILEGATVVLGDRLEGTGAAGATAATGAGDPTVAIESALAAASSHRAVVPAVDSGLVDSYRRAIHDGLSVDVALPGSAVRTLLEEFSTATARGLETGRLWLRETSSAPDYAVGVVDGHRRDGVGASAADPDGRQEGGGAVALLAVWLDGALCGVVLNDRPAALEWATARLDAVFADARPLTPGDGS